METSDNLIWDFEILIWPSESQLRPSEKDYYSEKALCSGKVVLCSESLIGHDHPRFYSALLEHDT